MSDKRLSVEERERLCKDIAEAICEDCGNRGISRLSFLVRAHRAWSVLLHAERRLFEKEPENSPAANGATWDYGWENLALASYRKLRHVCTDEHVDYRKELADALNYIAMAYDTLEQREKEGEE